MRNSQVVYARQISEARALVSTWRAVLHARMRTFVCYLFPLSFVNEPPYLRRLPSISVISGIKLANIAYNTTTHQHKQTYDHTHTHTYTDDVCVYLLPCSFLYDPPYLLRVPRMSMISGMKLANIAWRPPCSNITQLWRYAHYGKTRRRIASAVFQLLSIDFSGCIGAQSVHNILTRTF